MNDGSRFTVTITSGTIVRAILFVVLILAVFYLRDIVMVLLAAVVIASSLEPAIKWFEGKRVPRAIGALVIYAAVIVFLAAVLYVVLPPLISDTLSLVDKLPEITNTTTVTTTSNFFGFSPLFGGIADSTSLSNFLADLNAAISSTTGIVFPTFIGIFGGVLSFILIVVLSFYLSAQHDGVSNFLRLITPVQHEEYVVSLWKRSQAKIGLWMQGQVLLGVIVGLLVYLGLTILGIRHALPLAFLSAIFELIPVFGPILGAVPGISIALLDGGLTTGLLVTGLYIIIQQFESNLIYPLVVKKVVGVPPLLVIVALIVGFKLSGLLGGLLSIPVAAALVEYINDVIKRRRVPNS